MCFPRTGRFLSFVSYPRTAELCTVPKGLQTGSSLPFLIIPYGDFEDFPHRSFDWSEAHRRFVVSLGGHSDFQSMDIEGHWKSERNVGSAGYGAPGFVGLDRMFAWKSQYIREMVFRAEIADAFNVIKLEVFD